MASVARNSRRPSARGRSLSLPVPPGFSFERAVQGHGWFDLPPFHWDPEARRLTRILPLPAVGPAVARVTTPRAGGSRPRLKIDLTASGPLSRADLAGAARSIAHMLRLDEDLEEFYGRALEVDRPDLRWAARAGAGRLLRAPAVFEDLVKMICTTNCTWALTRVMVTALVRRLGEGAPEGMRAFPSPEAMASRPARFYRDTIRAGYRGEFLRDLARRVAGGELDLQAWTDPRRPTEEIRAEILSVAGAGPYVADNMLKLLGRYDGLGIDSWCRRKFSRMYHRGRAVRDAAIERFYEPFGRWRGLALWCDLTRDWVEDAGDGLARVRPLEGRRRPLGRSRIV